jgi:hypothetical protein
VDNTHVYYVNVSESDNRSVSIRLTNNERNALMEYLEFIMRDSWGEMYEDGVDIETADGPVIQEMRFLFAPSTLERP